jgi:hypothetical protein
MTEPMTSGVATGSPIDPDPLSARVGTSAAPAGDLEGTLFCLSMLLTLPLSSRIAMKLAAGKPTGVGRVAQRVRWAPFCGLNSCALCGSTHSWSFWPSRARLAGSRRATSWSPA